MMLTTALILAAGYGTRLQPLTHSIPKALVPISNRPLLEWILTRLSEQGIERFIINSHHLSDLLAEYLKSSEFSSRCTLYHEPEILETGGGIKNMVEQTGIDETVLVHNCDIFSSVRIQDVAEQHKKQQNQATLVVMNRTSSRHLVFDSDLNLCGRGHSADKANTELVRPCPQPVFLAFNGIQIIESGLFRSYPDRKFSSIDLYLDAAANQERIRGYVMREGYYKDVGKPEALRCIERDIQRGLT